MIRAERRMKREEEGGERNRVEVRFENHGELSVLEKRGQGCAQGRGEAKDHDSQCTEPAPLPAACARLCRAAV